MTRAHPHFTLRYTYKRYVDAIHEVLKNIIESYETGELASNKFNNILEEVHTLRDRLDNMPEVREAMNTIYKYLRNLYEECKRVLRFTDAELCPPPQRPFNPFYWFNDAIGDYIRYKTYIEKRANVQPA